MSYYQNLGQVYTNNLINDISYYNTSGPTTAYLRSDRASLVAYTPGDTIFGTEDSTYRLDMIFACDTNYESPEYTCVTAITTKEMNQDHLNFYLPHCPNGINNVKGFVKVIYEDAWPGINYHFLSNSTGIKNEIVANPYTDLTNIMFKFEGQDYMTIDNVNPEILEGYISGEEFSFPIIAVYQYSGQQIIPIPWTPSWVDIGNGFFKLTGFGSYDVTKPIVFSIGGPIMITTSHNGIDWSTYYGGQGKEQHPKVCRDKNQDYFYSGMDIINTRNYFPGVNGALDFPQGNQDIYISKFKNVDKLRKWATYVGGDDNDWLTDLTTNKGSTSQNVDPYVIFTANSWSNISFPPSSGFQQDAASSSTDIHRGGGLVALLDQLDGKLRYGTFLCPLVKGSKTGTESVEVFEYNSNIFITGSVGKQQTNDLDISSPNTQTFPVKEHASGNYVKLNFSGTSDHVEGFVQQIDLQNFDMQWSTLFHGTNDLGNTVVTDIIPVINVHVADYFIVGKTNQPSTFPLVDPGAGAYFQNTIGLINNNSSYPNSQTGEGFISRFSNYDLSWSTFFGGNDYDGIYDIDFNTQNNHIYIAGVTMTEHQASNTNIANFQMKFPLYAVNGAYQQPYGGGGSDLFVAEFGLNGELFWSTYLGGHDYDQSLFHNFTPEGTGQNLIKCMIDNEGTFLVCSDSRNWLSNNYPLENLNNYWNSNINPNCNINGVITGFNNRQMKWSTFYGGSGESFSLDFDFLPFDTKKTLVLALECFPDNPVHCSAPQYCQSVPAGNSDVNLTVFGYGEKNYPLDISSVNITKAKITLYPNPTENTLNLVSAEKLGHISVYNILGEKVLSTYSSHSSHSINTSQLVPGVYIVHSQNTKNHVSSIFTKL